MATRKPLVIGASGNIEQLQSGDDISIPVSATQVRSVTNGESSASLVIGTPVYVSAAGTVKKAQANAAATADVLGLMFTASTAAGASGYVQTDNVIVATTAQWDAVTGQTGGLTFGSKYFLDPTTAGKLTTTAPSTIGQLLVYVGKAISTTELDLSPESPILL